jgi:hypothetical protein
MAMSLVAVGDEFQDCISPHIQRQRHPDIRILTFEAQSRQRVLTFPEPFGRAHMVSAET